VEHLSEAELLMVAEGNEVLPETLSHLDSCSSCSAELRRLQALLSAVAAVDEPPISVGLLDQAVQGIMERIESLPAVHGHTSPQRKWWRGAKWVSAVALPLAAAMLLFLLPRQTDLPSHTRSSSASSSVDELLSSSQWDVVWYNLTDDIPELSVLHQVSIVEDDPYGQIRSMTEDQLESLLNLLGGSDFG
jgi:hypothetical protein